MIINFIYLFGNKLAIKKIAILGLNSKNLKNQIRSRNEYYINLISINDKEMWG